MKTTLIDESGHNRGYKSIGKWARHMVRPTGAECKQRQAQQKSAACGINAFIYNRL